MREASKFEYWYIRILGTSLLICAILTSVFGENVKPTGILAGISLLMGTIFSVLFFTKQKTNGRMG